MIFSSPVTKNSCGKDSCNKFRITIEKIADVTINMALKMLLAPITRAP